LSPITIQVKRNKGVHKVGFEEFLVAVEEVAARKVRLC
jgi:hypothetical protein